jgi:cell division protein FtsQ
VSAGRTRVRPRPPQVRTGPGDAGAPDDAGTPGGARPTPAPSDAQRRMRRRLRRRRLRRWVVVAVPVLVVVLLVTAAWVVLASPFLAVRDVRVVGAHRLTVQQVEQAAQIPMGRSLVRQDLGAARQRVEQLRDVKSATVTASWPHTVVVTVVERTPVAMAQATSGDWWQLDADGVWLAQSPIRPTGLVVIHLDPTTTSPDTLRAAASVAASLPASLRRLVEDVTALTPDSVRLDLVGGATVRWGSAQDSATKAQVLAVLLPRHAHVYDVTAPGFATTS